MPLSALTMLVRHREQHPTLGGDSLRRGAILLF